MTSLNILMPRIKNYCKNSLSYIIVILHYCYLILLVSWQDLILKIVIRTMKIVQYSHMKDIFAIGLYNICFKSLQIWQDILNIKPTLQLTIRIRKPFICFRIIVLTYRIIIQRITTLETKKKIWMKVYKYILSHT